MRVYYESLKRLYESGKATKEMLIRAVKLGKITEDERLSIEGISTEENN